MAGNPDTRPKGSAWKWALVAAAIGLLAKDLLRLLWPYYVDLGYSVSSICDLAVALLYPAGFISLVWHTNSLADMPVMSGIPYLYESANAAIYAVFGYGLWRVRSWGWRGYSAFGGSLVGFWTAMFAAALLTGVSTAHMDGRWETIIPARLSSDMIQRFQEAGATKARLIGVAGPPDCRLERNGRETLVYRALSQRRHTTKLFFVTTRVSYTTVEHLDFFEFESGAVAKHIEREETHWDESRDVDLGCEMLKQTQFQ